MGSTRTSPVLCKLAILLGVALSLASNGCQNQKLPPQTLSESLPQREQEAPAVEKIAETVPEREKSYKVGAGDELEVLLERYNIDEDRQPFEVSSNFIEKFGGVVFTKYKALVDPNGFVNIPLIGEIEVARRSTGEIANSIKEHLSKILVDPKVFVTVVGYASYNVYTLGEVRQPGRFQIERPINVSEAIALAGGITEKGTLNKVYIRRGGEAPTSVNIKEIWTKGKIENDFILERGDVVYVPHKLWLTWATTDEIATAIESFTNTYFQWKDR